MSNQKNKLSKNFIKQVVHSYNRRLAITDYAITKVLHKCKICTHRFIANPTDTTCPKCDETRQKVIYART
jgi:rubrerythrin